MASLAMSRKTSRKREKWSSLTRRRFVSPLLRKIQVPLLHKETDLFTVKCRWVFFPTASSIEELAFHGDADP